MFENKICKGKALNFYKDKNVAWNCIMQYEKNRVMILYENF